jgi:hypothetical protein
VAPPFRASNDKEAELRAQGVRIYNQRFGAQDFEPEYIIVSGDTASDAAGKILRLRWWICPAQR